MDASLTVALGLGFLLGLRHATEADHVAAMSTFVSRERGLLRSCLRGTFWGIGHTAALLIAGVVIIAFRVRIPPEVDRVVETCIALVLILLGGHVVLRAVSTLSVHRHVHVHGGAPHSHFHLHVGDRDSHDHVHPLAGARQPLLMGVLHGLGGGGALVLVGMAAMPSPAAAFLYLLVFGAGSTAGMLVLTGLMGIPFTLLKDRSRHATTALQLVVGAASMLIGVLMLTGSSGA